MKVLVIGANGQLGHDLCAQLSTREADTLVPLTHADVEVLDLAGLRRVLGMHRPDVIINTSAFHKVDVCEDEAERALAVNALGPRNLAIACRELDCQLIHLSTDYVFSGNKGAPYIESDPVDPINIYGISKVAGEMAVRYLWPRHCIVRTSGLYGVTGPSGKGSNFVELMLRLAREGKDIRVVDDQVLTPTPTTALAEQIVALAETGARGTYHATCGGACSWYEFAQAIFAFSDLHPSLAPQSTTQSGAKARRPAYSVLHNQALQDQKLDLLPPWQEGLRTYLRAR